MLSLILQSVVGFQVIENVFNASFAAQLHSELGPIGKRDHQYIKTEAGHEAVRIIEKRFNVSIGENKGLRVRVTKPNTDSIGPHRDVAGEENAEIFILYLNPSGGGTSFGNKTVDGQPGTAVIFGGDEKHAAPRSGDSIRSLVQYAFFDNKTSYSRNRRMGETAPMMELTDDLGDDYYGNDMYPGEWPLTEGYDGEKSTDALNLQKLQTAFYYSDEKPQDFFAEPWDSFPGISYSPEDEVLEEIKDPCDFTESLPIYGVRQNREKRMVISEVQVIDGTTNVASEFNFCLAKEGDGEPEFSKSDALNDEDCTTEEFAMFIFFQPRQKVRKFQTLHVLHGSDGGTVYIPTIVQLGTTLVEKADEAGLIESTHQIDGTGNIKMLNDGILLMFPNQELIGEGLGYALSTAPCVPKTFTPLEVTGIVCASLLGVIVVGFASVWAYRTYGSKNSNGNPAAQPFL